MRTNAFPSAFDSYKPPQSKVYGCICISDKNRILLVKGRKGQMWSFPKGHREKYDKTTLGCALRELREETGISLDLDYMSFKKFKAGEYYIFQVPYEYQTSPQDTSEIEEAAWMTYEEICKIRKNIDVSLFCQTIEKKILPEMISLEDPLPINSVCA